MPSQVHYGCLHVVSKSVFATYAETDKAGV